MKLGEKTDRYTSENGKAITNEIINGKVHQSMLTCNIAFSLGQPLWSTATWIWSQFRFHPLYGRKGEKKLPQHLKLYTVCVWSIIGWMCVYTRFVFVCVHVCTCACDCVPTCDDSASHVHRHYGFAAGERRRKQPHWNSPSVHDNYLHSGLGMCKAAVWIIALTLVCRQTSGAGRAERSWAFPVQEQTDGPALCIILWTCSANCQL